MNYWFYVNKIFTMTAAFIFKELFYCEQELWSIAFVCI